MVLIKVSLVYLYIPKIPKNVILFIKISLFKLFYLNILLLKKK